VTGDFYRGHEANSLMYGMAVALRHFLIPTKKATSFKIAVRFTW
jgi:hypothetical protein